MPTQSPMPDRMEFERLVRDALSKCYDHVALETHPLAALLPRGSGDEQSRAAQLRSLLERAVEALRPADGQPRPGSPEWRPYVLMRGRYLEGLSLQDLQVQVALSERQLRREQGRALEAVTIGLWDRMFPGQPMPRQEEVLPDLQAAQLDQASFPVSPSHLDLAELLQGVATILQRRAESEGVTIVLDPPPPGLRVLADRVIVRQILLAMLNYGLGTVSDGPVTIGARPMDSEVVVSVSCIAADAELLGTADTEKNLKRARYWSEQIEASLTISNPETCPGCLNLDLWLPLAGQPLVLVVDDQETALRMFQRYLKHTGLRLIGVRDGREILSLARRMQPQAITLDIMMPDMDGWEVLQNLQADPSTRHIPVIVCSVWEEPELASSLGASDFLKKPIMQTDLLAALARLHLVQT